MRFSTLRGRRARAALVPVVAMGLFTGGLTAARAATSHGSSTLPVSGIEQIEQADGTYSNGVLTIDIDRSDLHLFGPDRVPFKPGFQVLHQLNFQSLDSGGAMLNGEMAVTQDEVQPVIDSLLANHLVFQAFHQHFHDATPQIWFIHYRGTGDALWLPHAIHNVTTSATSTPLPQSSPSNPTTPLPAEQLGAILGGDVTVGESGVVTVDVPRLHPVVLGGHTISTSLGVQTEIQFEPHGGGQNAVAVPDFSMTGNEIPGVTRVARSFGFDDECLYNQETQEQPQLYFSHMYKAGDAVTLAKQIRTILDQTDAQGA